MLTFTTTILQFAQQGEKTGWTYILVPAAVAAKLNPGVKKSFRVKGKLDDFKVEKIALIPMGKGDFILTVNAAIRSIGKRKGATVKYTTGTGSLTHSAANRIIGMFTG